MKQHPFKTSFLSVTGWILAAIAAAGVLCSLLVVYCGFETAVGVADSIVYIFVLSGGGWYLFYLRAVLISMKAQAVIAVVVQSVALAGAFTVYSLAASVESAAFTDSIWLHVVSGFSIWIIISMWYEIKEKETVERNTSEEELIIKSRDTDSGYIDRISIKNGAKITLVDVRHLNYIQSYGDYVMLFTDNEKHLKEQTMKYYEANLPKSFVRIHRSYIVNTEQIARVELFGKETYNVYLKNGTVLRASSSGYKLLKENLDL